MNLKWEHECPPDSKDEILPLMQNLCCILTKNGITMLNSITWTLDTGNMINGDNQVYDYNLQLQNISLLTFIKVWIEQEFLIYKDLWLQETNKCYQIWIRGNQG